MDTKTNYSVSNDTVRLILAAIAMHGILSTGVQGSDVAISVLSVKYADALIKELQRAK